MLDFLGTVVIVTVMVVILNAFISAAQITRVARLWLAVGVGLWVGFATASSAAGMLVQPRALPLPGVFIVAPILIALIAAARYPTARTALLRVPMPLLVGLNVSRVFGAFFLVLASVGRLSGPFPDSAGWGDIITGLLAVPAVWLALRASSGGDRLLMLWNAFGALDLIAAVTLGIISANNSPIQLIHVGVGPAALFGLPWSLVPTVLVPFYLIAHGIIAVQLRQRAGRSRGPSTALATHSA